MDSLFELRMLEQPSNSGSYDPPSEPLTRPRKPYDDQLARELIREYYPDAPESALPPLTKRVLQHVDFLRSAYPFIDEVCGNRILDIACGSRNYPDNRDHLYDPWMLRLITHLDGQGVGVDLNYQSNERFEWHSTDLLTPHALDFLETGSFDAINVCAFPTRKVVHVMCTSGPPWETVRSNILRNLERVLKPGGKIIRTFTTETESYVQRMSASVEPPSPPREARPPLPNVNDWRLFDDFSLERGLDW